MWISGISRNHPVDVSRRHNVTPQPRPFTEHHGYARERSAAPRGAAPVRLVVRQLLCRRPPQRTWNERTVLEIYRVTFAVAGLWGAIVGVADHIGRELEALHLRAVRRSRCDERVESQTDGHCDRMSNRPTNIDGHPLSSKRTCQTRHLS
jgi:hypothetical protein